MQDEKNACWCVMAKGGGALNVCSLLEVQHTLGEFCLLSAFENFGCQLAGIPSVLSHEVVLNYICAVTHLSSASA